MGYSEVPVKQTLPKLFTSNERLIPLTHVYFGEKMGETEACAMNLYSLTRRFPTEKDALDHLIRTRWPKSVRCVGCDHGKCWPIESTNKTGGPRRLFQCASCKLQFSATSGTLSSMILIFL